jgi:hypothetical protein
MSRVIITTPQIAQSTDVLNAYVNPMISLGYALQMIFGDAGTFFDGLAATPSATPMSVDIAPGCVIEMSVVDATDYGDLPANLNPLMKLGVNTAPQTFPLTAAPSAGESVIWTIAGAFVSVDSVPVVIPYFDPANPLIPYSGPGNSGTPQNTLRDELVSLQAYCGAPSPTPVAPGVAAGYTPLWHITVPFGAAAITAGMITVEPTAPFIKNRLPNMAPTDSPEFTGTPKAPTPAAGDNSNNVATTAFVTTAVAETSGGFTVEQAARIAGDTNLQNELNAETAARIAEDTNLQTALTTEVAARIAADSGIVTWAGGQMLGGTAQTWADHTGSRATNTTFTNSTGRPIFVYVTIGSSVGDIALGYFINGIGTLQAWAVGSSADQIGSVNFIVPNGSTYEVVNSAGTLATWCELS